MTSMTNGLNISLEPHLAESLTPIASLIPDVQIDIHAATIPYSTLRTVSKWSRTQDGSAALKARSLDPAAYSEVSLLAGATTSPESNLGQYTPPPDPADVEADKARERKAITSLVNAVLSVVGSGVAAFWASDKAGWRHETVRTSFCTYEYKAYHVQRVLFALLVAVVVAVAEGALFLIWQSGSIQASPKRKRLRVARHKKDDDEADAAEPETVTEQHRPGLRHRVLEATT